MTMRSYRYFACQNGHEGEEKTAENDQPYSTTSESVTVSGMREQGHNKLGYATYVCEKCGQPMPYTHS